jgi:S-adenosylhomocysteine hydrolase
MRRVAANRRCRSKAIPRRGSKCHDALTIVALASFPTTLHGGYTVVLEPRADERAGFRSPHEERWVQRSADTSSMALEVDRAFKERRAWLRLSANYNFPITLTRPIVPRFALGIGGAIDTPAIRRECEKAMADIRVRFGPSAAIAAAEPIVAPHMPALEAVEEGVSSDHFADCDMIAVQPGYASTVSLLDALHRHGLDYRRLTFIGKSYSTHYGVARALLDRGATVPLETLDQDALEDHEAVMEASIRRALDREVERVNRGEAKRHLLALDDGGLIAKIVRDAYPELLPRLRVVEQTTRGLRRLEEMGVDLPFPAARVGSADLKLLEMPHVGLSAFWEILRKLSNIGDADPQRLEISVNGQGNVGRAVAMAYARRGFRVRTYDPDPRQLLALHPNITPVADRTEFLSSADVLISGTGTAPIKVADYRLLPNQAKVFNVASSNDELDAAAAIAASRLEQKPRAWWSPDWIFDKAAYVESLPELLQDDEYAIPETGWVYGRFRGMDLPLGQLARAAQRDRLLHLGDKVLYLASNGFVVNHLTDCEDPIPARYIQPTRAALFIGCVEAMEPDRKNGPFEIDPHRQEIARKAYLADVGDELDDPKWLPDWVTSLRVPA